MCSAYLRLHIINRLPGRAIYGRTKVIDIQFTVYVKNSQLKNGLQSLWDLFHKRSHEKFSLAFLLLMG